MFSVICAAGGTAPAAPHHGHPTFNFNQAAHAAFGLLMAGGGGGAPPGCCLALTMAWMQSWRNQPMQAFGPWVNGAGAAGVLANTVAVFGPPGPWHVTTTVLMGGLGFGVAFPGLVPGPPWLGGAGALPALVLSAPYTILVASGPAGAHAVGVRRTGTAVHFFDANHGEVYFPTATDFANWFYGGGYSNHCLSPGVGAAAPTLHSLRYN